MRISPRRPADIYKLPPGASSLADDDSHYHLLLRECDDGEIASLEWGSSQQTQAHFGAANHSVKPTGFLGINANGLRKTTYFYGSVIVLCEEALLGERNGRATRELTAARKCLRSALGIGSGLAAPHNSGSLRGWVAATEPYDKGPDISFDHALIVTEHVYSAAGKYQLVVPIVPGGVGVEVDQHVVRTAGEPWVEWVADGTDEALLLTPLLQSVWQEDVLDLADARLVDAHTLARVEDELCAYFRLPDKSAC